MFQHWTTVNMFLCSLIILILTACFYRGLQRSFLLWEDPWASWNPSSPLESARILYSAKRKWRTDECICVEGINCHNIKPLLLEFQYLVMRGRFVSVLPEYIKWCSDGVGCVNVHWCSGTYVLLITCDGCTVHPATHRDPTSQSQAFINQHVVEMYTHSCCQRS